MAAPSRAGINTVDSGLREARANPIQFIRVVRIGCGLAEGLQVSCIDSEVLIEDVGQSVGLVCEVAEDASQCA